MQAQKSQYDISAAIAYIQSQKGTKSFVPDYDISNGLTAWRFGDLAIAKGYRTAVWYAELIRDRVPGIPPNSTLLTTFSAYQQAEKENTPQLCTTT